MLKRAEPQENGQYIGAAPRWYPPQDRACDERNYHIHQVAMTEWSVVELAFHPIFFSDTT